MFSKNNPDLEGKVLPDNLLAKLNLVMNEYFKAACQSSDRVFQTYGRIIESELVLIFSLTNHRSEQSSISLFLSLDIDSNNLSEKNLTKTLYDFADLGQLFFQDIIEDKDWSDYAPRWEKHSFRNKDFFYKVTRENPELTMQAHAILNSVD
jgi:hypothetical protein